MHEDKIRLTQSVSCAGCAAKISSKVLSEVLAKIPLKTNPNLLVGIETADDAGVYLIADDVAIVQTTDFFPPIVDDPYEFGAIAATNALSDIYAMGARPVTGLNIVGFPMKSLPLTILEKILLGGIEKLHEADAVVVGGHSLDDVELKYGMAVTGTVHPERIFTNTGARQGDGLVLTKPIGIGIITTAAKMGSVSDATLSGAVESMMTLNRAASEAMIEVGAHACTDVTGFGLIGHAWEMATASNVGMTIYASKVPRFEEATALAAERFLPGGSVSNIRYFSQFAAVDTGIQDSVRDVIFDAQTSGGLLIAVPPDRLRPLLESLKAKGVRHAAEIGEVTAAHPGRIDLKP